ncbi:LPXTG cell wall anchor domain-containing protein [Listeria sp. FSL L7-1517]|uniref:LPXTG cell wall anchor domain-containing protein n=1 Tax=Listeria immobilis TaxID=2713502 RepID=UPI00164E5F37|nr:LPXTG cell wall anchor domain-containing protein [Listeria immobilis]MBC6296312.1 LPXTG cell wall anchor domain-containing protein [Listeria immobilis]
MKNLKKGIALTLAFGLALSISTPAYATDTEDGENTETIVTPDVVEKNTTEEKDNLKASPNAVIAKTGLAFEIDSNPVASDFVTINDNGNNPTFTFKNGQPETSNAGDYSTIIVVDFDDATSIELTVNYTVNVATPLATLKTTAPTIAQDSKPTPMQFVDAAPDVTLSFKSGAPSTKKTGSFTTTIVATKAGISEELIATFAVTDQTPPSILSQLILLIIRKGDTLDYDAFVKISDNSGKFTVAYKPGHEASSTTLGYQEAIIIATDSAGNTREATISYFVANNVPTLKKPVINTTTSNASTIYGTTSPNVIVDMDDSDGNTLASAYSDEEGNFILTLEKPLKSGDKYSLVAYNYSFDYSEEVIYSYNEYNNLLAIVPMPAPPDSPKSEVKPKIKISNKKETFKKLPKTGDTNSLPLAFIGLLLVSGTVITLRKKHA